MDGHGLMTVVACAGDLAFGALAFLRRARSSLAGLTALLFFDAFTWNFAGLAYELSRVELWHQVDRFFSSMMAAIALQVVVVFVGRARALKPFIIGAYAFFGAVGLFASEGAWWRTLAVAGPLAMTFAVTLLVIHRRRTGDVGERARTDLLLLAILVGTLFASTDLWYRELSFPIPRLGAIGTLLAMILFAAATLRLQLLGRDVPPLLAVYALLFGALWVVLHLALTHWLEPRSGQWVLGAGVLLVVGLGSARELGRVTALGRARTAELATLGRFSEQLAHDIKNPLAAMKGAVQFLEEEHRLGRSLDGQTQFLALMRQQIERMQRIVADYQRIARVEPRPSPTSLTTLVSELLAMQRFQLASGVSIDARLASGLPECFLDRDLVATALENLVRNACEALPKGGAITVRTAQEDDMVTVSVRDEGEGMDARALEQATLLFFTTKAHGTGLGLSFAEKVAKAHGGVMRLTSALGRGTTVTMSFRPHTEVP